MSERIRKTIQFEEDEIEAIEREMESNPSLRGRSFSNAIRWLISLAIGAPEDDNGDKELSKGQ